MIKFLLLGTRQATQRVSNPHFPIANPNKRFPELTFCSWLIVLVKPHQAPQQRSPLEGALSNEAAVPTNDVSMLALHVSTLAGTNVKIIFYEQLRFNL